MPSSAPRIEQAPHNCSLLKLQKSLETVPLPSGWVDLTSPDVSRITLSKLQCYSQHPDQPVHISRTLQINPDLTWDVFISGQLVTRDRCSLLSDVPAQVTCPADYHRLFTIVHTSNVCCGNPDKKFEPLKKQRRGTFKNVAGDQVIAFVDTKVPVCDGNETHAETIRHSFCELLTEKGKCIKCVSYRDSLRSMLSRSSKQARDQVSQSDSHANFRCLNPPEMSARYHHLRKETTATKKEVKRLQKLLEDSATKQGVNVDEDVHDSLVDTMKANEAEVEKAFPQGSFRRLFWQQQFEAATKSNSCQMRWHPMMIKWCLHLKLRSSSSYDALRRSGCLTLPSERTLRDYTHHFKAGVGFQTEVDEQLLSEANVANIEEWKKYVVLLIDEMNIKEDLVYNKGTGELIGFTNVGDINNHLDIFETAMANNARKEPELATSMLVLMVRGIFMHLAFPYAHFPCTNLTAQTLYPLVWEAVGRLESLGLKVLVLTADGASPNRKFFRMHQAQGQVEKVTDIIYKTPNPYSDDSREIYFMSDVPHLIKTTRNCWANKKRHLWVRGKEISWGHLMKLYHGDLGANRSAGGLCLLPKLKYEHVYLTSFSKMRVNLAAQVLSESVSKALSVFGGPEVEETVKFTDMFNKFFDSLNSRNCSASYQTRKLFLKPYFTPNDFRLNWLKNELLGYLHDWEASVEAREGFSALAGRHWKDCTLQIVQHLFKVPGVKFILSEHLCQDPIEKYFGKQRQRGATNENPSVLQVINNAPAIRLVNSVELDPVRGTCGRHSARRKLSLDVDDSPIPKKPRLRSSSKQS